MNNMEKLINWSELSRYITKGDRNGIRFGKIPKKHIPALDQLFNVDLPAFWAEQNHGLIKPTSEGEKIKDNLKHAHLGAP